MSEDIAVTKDEKNQQSIPTDWRSTLALIVEAIKSSNFPLLESNTNIKPISQSDMKRIRENIEDYGCSIISLPEATWNTSACHWMRGYWDVLVDLYTIEEGASDLVLSVRVHEQQHGIEYEVMSVHAE